MGVFDKFLDIMKLNEDDYDDQYDEYDEGGKYYEKGRIFCTAAHCICRDG